MKDNAVLVIFKNHNERFNSLHQAAVSLGITDHSLLEAIKNGKRVNTAAGLVYADWLEEK